RLPLWKKWLRIVNDSKGTHLLLVGLIAWTAYEHDYPGTVICTACLFVFPGIVLWYGQSGRLFARLNKARAWHRWNEVLACVEKLKQAKARTNVGVPETVLVRYRAQALAGLGRFDE